MVGNTVLVTVWLAVGVLGVIGGLLWLRAVERAHRTSAQGPLVMTRPSSSATASDAREPDALAG
jgi:hypothetical protein